MAMMKGGDRLQKHLQEILKRVQNSNAVHVGFLEDATYPDGTPVAAVAAVNEYGREVKSKDGNYYQMPRPFFRGMIAKHKNEWGSQLGVLMVKNNYDAHKSLALMGEEISGQLRESIQDLSDPPLAPSTVKAKGFDKPLVDSQHMLNSVDFEVKE